MSDPIVEIPLDQLHPSPFNPRKHFSDEALQQLATDIRSTGRVLQPLLVRPRTTPLFAGDPNDQTGFEIVFGHRRHRASEIAELATVPCMVRAMTDEEAKRAQISENLQREDVHPIEEAEGFDALMRDHGMTADAIAEQTGKSRSYVYGRLKLLQACPQVREACLAGTIGSEVALLVARLRTVKLQEKALEYIGKDYRADLHDGGKASTRAVKALLNEKFTLDLKDAIFPIQDESLLPAAGTCGACPKRSGNAPEFEDIAVKRDSADHYRGDWLRHDGPMVCTDPDCFDAKKKAHLKREAARLEAEGKAVVDGAKARQAIGADGKVKGAYVSAKEARAAAKAAGVKPAQLELVTIQDPRTGKVVEAVAKASLAAAGVPQTTAPAPAARDDWLQRSKEREARSAAENKVRREIFRRIREAAHQVPRSTFDLRLAVEQAIEDAESRGDVSLVAEAWGLATDNGTRRATDALLDLVESSDADDLGRMLLDLTLAADLLLGYYNDEALPENVMALAGRYRVDVDQVRAEVQAPASTPSPAARAATGGRKKAKPKARPAAESSGEPIGPEEGEGSAAAVAAGNVEGEHAGAAS